MSHKMHDWEQKIKHNVEEKMHQGKEFLHSGMDQMQKKLTSAQDIAVSYAKEYPFHAIGISFIAGLAIAQLLGRKDD